MAKIKVPCRKYNSTTWAEILELSNKVNLQPCFEYDRYSNQKENLDYKCLNTSCGRIAKKKLENIRNGSGCYHCSSLLYERIVRIAMESIFDCEFPKDMPETLTNSDGNRMHFDGFNEQKRIAFEHQGDQHTDPQSYIYRHLNVEQAKHAFKKRKRDDDYKREWCAKQEPSIKLIEIPCLVTKVSICDLQQFIINEAKRNGLEIRRRVEKQSIDFSAAYKHNPTIKWLKKFSELNIDVDLRVWTGTNSMYDFSCRTCENTWSAWLYNVKCCPQCHIESISIDTEAAIKMLQEIAADIGRTPTSGEVERDIRTPSVNAYRNHFGSFNNALQVAGLDLNKRVWNQEELLEVMNEEFSGQNFVSYGDVFDNDNLPYPNTLVKFFGSVQAAVELIGKRYVEQLNYSKDQLIKILKDFYESYNRAPVQKELLQLGLPAIDTFIHHFDSYNSALDAAGIPVNRRTNMTDDELLAMLKVLGQKIGRAPETSDIDGEIVMPSARTYQERFGSLMVARERAGFPRGTKSQRSLPVTKNEILTFALDFSEKNQKIPTGADFDRDPKAPSGSSVRRHFGSLYEFNLAVNELLAQKIETQK